MVIHKVLRWSATAVLVIASLASARNASAQGAVITGKITTEQGREVEGINAVIPELNISVGTNAAGIYTISIPAARLTGGSAVLRVRGIGFLPQIRTVSLTAGSQTVNFILAQDINRLEAVVTTGVTGATATTKLPFSVAKIDTSDMKVPAANPLSQLAGKIPGAMIMSTSGRPGASPAVLLRGPTAISGDGRGQQPLYIIDGVVLTDQGASAGGGGLPDINPLDIESVEVVKGAAAASLYGARAGAGVITIRTKSGLSASEGVHFSARSEYGQSDIEHLIPVNQAHSLLLDESGTKFCIQPAAASSTRFSCAYAIDYATEVFRINDQSDQFPLDPVGTFPIDPGSSVGGSDFILRDSYLVRSWPGPNYDQVATFAQPKPVYNNSFDMRAHYGKTSIFSSVSGFQQGGSIRFLPGYQRFTGRLNLDQQIADRWSATLTSYYARAAKNGFFAEDGGSGFFRLTRTLPNENLEAVDSKGRLLLRTNLGGGGIQNYNPLYYNQTTFDPSRTNHFIGGGTLRYAPFSWMDLDGQVSYDGSQSNLTVFRDKDWRINDFGALDILHGQASALIKASEQLQSYSSGVNMNIRHDFFQDFQTRTTFRYSFAKEDYDERQAAVGILAVQGVPSISNGTVAYDPFTGLVDGSTVRSVRSIGFVVAENFDIKDRYIVDALVRRDGSSLFGRANRWKTFGRGSLAWRVAQEPWWFVPQIDELKLRASVGTAGGRPGFSYQYQTYNITTGLVSAVTLGNKFLKPESIRENEYGLDMQAFHRIGLTLNYAKSVARDQILNVPLSVATGFASQWQNAGVLENKSYEASLNVPIINGRDVQYSTRLIYDRNRAQVTHLYVPSFNPGATLSTNTLNIFLVCSPVKGEAGYCDPAKNQFPERFGTFYGRMFATSCGQLPAQAQASCGPGQDFQKNQDGWIVWVGKGNSVTDGITKNLWNARLPVTSPFFSPTANGKLGFINRGVAVNWGMPMIVRDSTGSALQMPLGNPLPKYRWGFSQTLNYKKFSAYALIDAARGQVVYNQGRGWSYLDFLEGHEDQRNKSVGDAKPLGYYYRAGPPDQSRLGGLYDVLGANNAVTEDASYTKLRELQVGYHFGEFGAIGGDWSVSVIGRNLKTWTKYTGFDPEVGSGAVSGTGSTTNGPGSGAITAIDAFTFPNVRSVTFSLSTSF